MLEHVFLSKQKKARKDPKPVIDKVAKRYGIYANMLVDTLVTMDKQSIKILFMIADISACHIYRRIRSKIPSFLMRIRIRMSDMQEEASRNIIPRQN